MLQWGIARKWREIFKPEPATIRRVTGKRFILNLSYSRADRNSDPHDVVGLKGLNFIACRGRLRNTLRVGLFSPVDAINGLFTGKTA